MLLYCLKWIKSTESKESRRLVIGKPCYIVQVCRVNHEKIQIYQRAKTLSIVEPIVNQNFFEQHILFQVYNNKQYN